MDDLWMYSVVCQLHCIREETTAAGYQDCSVDHWLPTPTPRGDLLELSPPTGYKDLGGPFPPRTNRLKHSFFPRAVKRLLQEPWHPPKQTVQSIFYKIFLTALFIICIMFYACDIVADTRDAAKRNFVIFLYDDSKASYYSKKVIMDFRRLHRTTQSRWPSVVKKWKI